MKTAAHTPAVAVFTAENAYARAAADIAGAYFGVKGAPNDIAPTPVTPRDATLMVAYARAATKFGVALDATYATINTADPDIAAAAAALQIAALRVAVAAAAMAYDAALDAAYRASPPAVRAILIAAYRAATADLDSAYCAAILEARDKQRKTT